MSVLSSLTNRIFSPARCWSSCRSASPCIASTSRSRARRKRSCARASPKPRRSSTSSAALSSPTSSSRASSIADLPVLKNATATDDPPTVQPDRRPVPASRWMPICSSCSARRAVCWRALASSAGRAGDRRDRGGLPRQPGRHDVLAVCGRRPPRRLAGARAGAGADRDARRRVQPRSGGRAAIQDGHQQRDRLRARADASSRRRSTRSAPRSSPASRTRPACFTSRLGGEDYIGRVQPLGAGGAPGEPVALVLRSRTEHLQFLPTLRWQIAITGLAAVLVATLVGYGIARTVTRPLRALTATMREMAATGDLARTVPRGRPLGRRGRAAALDDVPPAHRRARPISARSGAARAPVVARPALDGRRARGPQPADDHQVGGPEPPRASVARRDRGRREHRRGSRSGSTVS